MIIFWTVFSIIIGALVGLGIGILNSWCKISKKLLCMHEYEFYCNIYGDWIIHFKYKRSLWKCTRCGKRQFRKELNK
jgi:tricorn protease-like protein